jgi:hypothetical protein
VTADRAAARKPRFLGTEKVSPAIVLDAESGVEIRTQDVVLDLRSLREEVDEMLAGVTHGIQSFR